jgi:hypothetical protein
MQHSIQMSIECRVSFWLRALIIGLAVLSVLHVPGVARVGNWIVNSILPYGAFMRIDGGRWIRLSPGGR